MDGQGSIPGRGKGFLHSTESRLDPGPIQYPMQWVSWATSPGVKQLENEADLSRTSSATVKNGGLPSWCGGILIKVMGITSTFTMYNYWTNKKLNKNSGL